MAVTSCMDHDRMIGMDSALFEWSSLFSFHHGLFLADLDREKSDEGRIDDDHP